MGSDLFDLIVILLLVFFSLAGARNGFIAEVAGILSLVVGFVAANACHGYVAHYFTFIVNPTLRSILTYLLIFICAMLLVSAVARLLQKVLALSFAQWVDKMAGFLFGLLKGLCICSMLILVAQAVFAQAPFLQNAHTVPYLRAFIEQMRAWMPDDLTSVLQFYSK